MRRIIKTIKNYLGEIMLIIGTGIFTNSVSDFFHTYAEWTLTEGQYYYYTDDTRSLITIGAILIVWGILIIKKRNEK